MSESMELTNDVLKGIMTDALVAKPICEDMNTCISPGVYTVTPQTLNVPAGLHTYGSLWVGRGMSFYGTQLYFARGTITQLAYRLFIPYAPDYDLGPWVLLQGTILQ